MAHIVADRIRDTTTTTGTGAVTVSGTPPATYKTFSARMTSPSDTCAYFIAHRTADEWECGIGTYSASNTLTRTTVLSSSNSDAAVSFSAGTKDVVLTQVADRGYQKSGVTVVGNTVTASAPALDISQTWNAGGVTFTAAKINVTNTASATASKLLDLQVGGTSLVSFTNNGNPGPSITFNDTVQGTYTQSVSSNRAAFNNGIFSGAALTVNGSIDLGFRLGQFDGRLYRPRYFSNGRRLGRHHH